MGIAILEANTETHFLQFAEIVKEYFVWLRGRYQDMQWLIDQVATVQSLENELNDLPLKYSMPTGMAFIATVDGVLAGVGAWRNQPDGSCEMKRVFVRNNFKGIGVGRELCDAIMQSARKKGYKLMRLDTGKRMTEAQGLYRKLGFASCHPYQDYPENIIRELEFMQATLQEC